MLQNGQTANQEAFNNAFVSRTQNSTMNGELKLQDPNSGATVDNVQQAINDLASDIVGKADTSALTALASTVAGKADTSAVTAGDAATLAAAQAAISTAIANLVASSPSALDTLNELAAALGNDANFATTVTNALAGKAPSANPDFTGSIQAEELGSDPSTPISGKRKLFAKADGFYQKDSSGTVSKVGSGAGSGIPNYMSANPDAEAVALTPWIKRSFGGTSFPWSAVVSTGSDTIAHSLAAGVGLPAIGDTVSFSGGTLPSPLVSGTTYYVSFADSTNIKVSATKFGASIDLTTTGSGTGYMYFGVPVTTRAGAPGGVMTLATFTRETVASGWAPPYGTAAFVFSKPSGNAMGDSAGYPLTIDVGDQGRNITTTFEYAVASGTYASGKALVTVYDETNKTRVYSGDLSIENHGLKSATGRLTFQAAHNSTSYTLWITVADASSTAWALYFDKFQCGTYSAPVGAPVTDWVAYTPTFSNFGTVSNVSFFSRRDGDSLEVMGKWTNGTTVGALASITLGYAGTNGNVVQDSAKIATGQLIGHAVGSVASGSHFGLDILAVAGSNAFNYSVQNSTINAATAANGNSIGTGSGAAMSLFLKVPIIGWTSNVVMSNEISATDVTTSVSKSVGQSISTGAVTQITFDTVYVDKCGKWSNNQWIVPETTNYLVSGALNFSDLTAAIQGDVRLVVDSAITRYAIASKPSTSGAQRLNISYSWVVPLRAGQVVQLQAYQGSGSTQLISGNNDAPGISILNITKASGGSQQIAATDQVGARYSSGAGQALPATGTWYTIVYGNKSYDDRGAMNASTGVFTAPASGRYRIRAQNTMNTTNTQATIYTRFLKNGSTSTAVSSNSNTYLTAYWAFSLEDTVPLLQGETIVHQIQHNMGSTSMLADAAQNYITFERVGNY